MTYLTSKKEIRLDKDFQKTIEDLDEKFWKTIQYEEKLHHINTDMNNTGNVNGNQS